MSIFRYARSALIFIVFVALFLSGVSVAAVSVRIRSADRRGVRDAATDNALPYRLPPGGVNIDLTRHTPDQLPLELDRIAALGLYWLRQPLRWSEIEPTEGAFDWSKYAVAIETVHKDGRFGFIFVLDESPVWARKPEAEGSRYAPPASPTTFARFAGAAAARFKGKGAWFQVWDEPNLREHWGNLDPRPAEYMAMLRAAYPAIKSGDPVARVLAAGLAPTVEEGPRNLSDLAFLTALYADGARDFMDGVAGKPYGFNASPLDRTADPTNLNFSRFVLLREIMERNSDAAKPLFGTQFGWNSLPTGWTGAPSRWGQVDTATQETYTRAAYDRATREWPWAGALILENWEPNAPADHPLQGFAIRDRAETWAKNRGLVPPSADVLSPGLHPPTDPIITYSGNWRFGPLGADIGLNTDSSLSSFRVKFQGSAVALQVRRADYVAYLYVTIDGQPANALPRDTNGQAFILLTSPNRQPQMDMITVAQGLNPDILHTLEVRAYLGYERWSIAGIGVSALPVDERFPLIMGGLLLCAVAGVGLAWRLWIIPWGRVRGPAGGVVAYARRMADVGFGIAVTFAAGIGMLLTFGGALPNLFRRDEPAVILTILTAGIAYFSPGLLLSAAAILALFILIYNKPALGLCLVAFFAPFFLYPVQNYVRALPMVELALVLTALATLLRCVISALRKRVRPSFAAGSINLIDLAFVAFGMLAVLTLLWSEQRAPALRELRIIIIEPILYYFLIQLIRLDQKDVLRLVDTLIAAGAAVCVLGMIGFFVGGAGVVAAEGGTRRLGSIYGSPNNVALFIGRCLPFALAFALFPLSPLRRVVAGVITVLMLGSVLLTQSAGALLFGIPAAGAVVLLVWDRRKGAILTALGVAALIIGGVVLLPRLQSAFGGGRESSLARVNVWTSAVNLIQERPITGAGLDQFLYLYRSRYILPDAYKEPDLSHPHNVLLDFWVRLGIGGVILLIALQLGFWRAVTKAFRRLRNARRAVREAPPGAILGLALCAGLMGSMADFLAHGLVDNSYFVVDLAYVFCLSFALVVRSGRVSPGTLSSATVSAEPETLPI